MFHNVCLIFQDHLTFHDSTNSDFLFWKWLKSRSWTINLMGADLCRFSSSLRDALRSVIPRLKFSSTSLKFWKLATRKIIIVLKIKTKKNTIQPTLDGLFTIFSSFKRISSVSLYFIAICCRFFNCPERVRWCWKKSAAILSNSSIWDSANVSGLSCSMPCKRSSN